MWANAASVTSSYRNVSVGTTIPESAINAYFVWIPRYEYLCVPTANVLVFVTVVDPLLHVTLPVPLILHVAPLKYVLNIALLAPFVTVTLETLFTDIVGAVLSILYGPNGTLAVGTHTVTCTATGVNGLTK